MANKKFDKLSERQRNILRFMQRYMEKHGYPPTIREIGEATGINSTSVVNYNLNKLVTEGYLERSDRVSRGLRLVGDIPGGERKAVRAAKSILRVPVIGQIVASAPAPVPDQSYFSDEDMLEVTNDMLRGSDPAATFALRVKGDSMIDAMVRDGDVVILRRQETARDGEMVAVWLEDRGETTLKYYYPEGERIRLQPAHPTMDAIYVAAAKCHIQGKVLSVLRQIG